MKRRLLPGALFGMLLLAGCAALNTVQTDISTFGDWPASRKPGTYAFDRLPSQQTRPEDAALLEDAARPALAQAGFAEAAPGAKADVAVQLALRVARTDVDPWVDPFWWHGGFGLGRRYGGYGTGFGMGFRTDYPRYDREVALLIRDIASGKPLYEARATHEGTSYGTHALTAAMFRAALFDFPHTGPNPRSVNVPLS